ncbi:MAG: histidinol-phosphate transaminase [Desulfobacterales bacterium]
MNLPVPDYILAIQPYEPGKPCEELEREYGISDSVKLASNENPLGPSPLATAAISGCLNSLHRYPDATGYRLTRQLAAKLGVPPASIVLGNGSDDLIGMLARVFLQPGDEVLIPRPAFLMYDITVRAAGAVPVYSPLRHLVIDLEDMAKRVGPKTRMVFITNPHNPTGSVVTRAALDGFLAALPADVVVVLDEAYLEFVRDPDSPDGCDYLDENRLLVALRTFSKAYGLAGLRIGYGIMPQAVAELIHRIRQPFNTNALAQAAACAALADHEHLARTLKAVHDGLAYLQAGLQRMHVRYFATEANFFLVDLERDAAAVNQKLLRQGVIVRPMGGYGYPRYLRVNAGLPSENERFLKALAAAL